MFRPPEVEREERKGNWKERKGIRETMRRGSLGEGSKLGERMGRVKKRTKEKIEDSKFM